jgi:hypothetical protein
MGHKFKLLSAAVSFILPFIRKWMFFQFFFEFLTLSEYVC